jgi:hypothetical protein
VPKGDLMVAQQAIADTAVVTGCMSAAHYHEAYERASRHSVAALHNSNL